MTRFPQNPTRKTFGELLSLYHEIGARCHGSLPYHLREAVARLYPRKAVGGLFTFEKRAQPFRVR